MKLIRSPLSFVDLEQQKEYLDNIKRPPYLNEHRDYVLKDLLKYSDLKIKELREAKAII
jgi:crotonobetainyl-CoA:carnitine CoA-transferase CaiB-like acyl-CoA transferase